MPRIWEATHQRVNAMRVLVRSTLDAPPEAVWAEVQTSRLLLEIIAPLLRFVPLKGETFPQRWEVGTTRGRAYAFGFIPIGVHTIHHDRVDPNLREIHSREHSRLVQSWDHLISVKATPDGRTAYADEIEISAGLLTPVVWLYAQCFYRHRQRRWRSVAARLLSQPGTTADPAIR